MHPLRSRIVVPGCFYVIIISPKPLRAYSFMNCSLIALLASNLITLLSLSMSFFLETDIVPAPYSFFASHPRKMPPCSKEMMMKKISANRMKTKDGIRIRVYFFPKAVPFLIALPMPER